MKNKDIEVYIGDYHLIWLDSSLYIKSKGEKKAITMTSGEYENDIGTFFLSTANLLDVEAEYAIKVMKAIADPKTIKEMPSLKILEITQFTLKEPYLSKVIDLEMKMYYRET